MNDIEFTTVASFDSSLEAWNYRNHLAVEGLSPIVTDEHAVTTHWTYSNALGGIKVQIPQIEIERFNSIAQTENEYSFPEFENDESESELSTCPQCNSIEIVVSKWPKRLVYLTMLLFGFPLPIYAIGISCNDCGFEDKPTFSLPTQFNIIHLIMVSLLVQFVLAICSER